jgi:hypothetical protein
MGGRCCEYVIEGMRNFGGSLTILGWISYDQIYLHDNDYPVNGHYFVSVIPCNAPTFYS